MGMQLNASTEEMQIKKHIIVFRSMRDLDANEAVH